MRLLEAIRAADVDTRFYQASSSELYGATPPPQSELTPFLAALPLRRRQALRLLGDGELPRGLRHARRPTASCSTTSPPAAAPPSSPARSPGPSAQIGRRPAGRPLPGQPRRGPRLGLRQGVRRGHVADAAARLRAGLRPRDRRPGHRARLLPGGVLPSRPGLGAPTCTTTSATSARARWTPSSATPAAPAWCWTGPPAPGGTTLARLMVDADVRLLDDQLAGRLVTADR